MYLNYISFIQLKQALAYELKRMKGNVSFMRRKNVNNAIIRECITESLLRLMKQKPFPQIAISEITQLAGVARVSFYRNYESKEDILVQMLNEAALVWFDEISKEANGDVVLGLFRHSLEMREIAILVYQHDLSHLLLKNICDCVGPKPGNTEEEAYHNAFLAGSMFGVLDEWIRRGMTTSPETMRGFFPQLQNRSFEQNKSGSDIV